MVKITEKLEITVLEMEGRPFPQSVKKDKWYPVIGYKIEKKQRTDGSGEYEAMTWIILNENHRPFYIWESQALCRILKGGAA